MPKEVYCTTCGSTDIVHEVVERMWDVVTQDFVDFDVQERKFCWTCHAEAECDWREITDVKILAKIAIHNGVK